MWARLEREAKQARRIVAVRLCDRDDDPRGFEELRLIGLPREDLAAELTRRFRTEPLPGTPLCRLVPSQ
jgi:hypothetical protein